MNKTNNDIMWDCFEDILNKTPSYKKRIANFIYSFYKHKGKEVEENFSYDNWALVTCWLQTFDKDTKSLIPSFGRHVWHPIRFIKFLWMKYPLLSFLQVITVLDMVVRHGIIRRKTADGHFHTSGLLLDYYIAHSYNSKLTMFILTKLMLTMFKSWIEVFYVYHGGNENNYNYKVYEAYTRSK